MFSQRYKTIWEHCWMFEEKYDPTPFTFYGFSCSPVWNLPDNLSVWKTFNSYVVSRNDIFDSKLTWKCFSKRPLYSFQDGSCKMKNVPDLVQLNMEKKEILMPSSFIDVGTKAKTIISDFDNESDIKKFYSSCQKCYLTAFSYLLNNLPFNSKTIKYSQNLCPQKRNSRASTSAISNLCLKIVKMFQSSKNIWVTIGFHKWFHWRCFEKAMENVPTWTYDRVNVRGRK